MTKASISLQDLRRRLYVKAKTEPSWRSLNLDAKPTGKRSAGNPHAAFDAAGTGNVARSRYCDTRQPKGASNGEYKHRPNPARQPSTLHQVGRFKSGTVGANRSGSLPEIPHFDWTPVKTEFEARKHNIELVDDSRVDLVNRYKNILVPAEPYDDLRYSVKEGYVKEREPVSLRVVLCNMIAESRERTIKPIIVLDRKSTDIDVSSIGELWQDESLPIGTDCIISAHLQFHEKDTLRPINGIFMYGVGPSTIRIRFDLMEQSNFEASFGKKPSKARITLKLRLLKGSTNGLSWYNAVWVAHNFMHGKTPYTPGGKQSTAIHELGHFVDMVNSRQQTWYVDHGHQGPHCSTGLSKSDTMQANYQGLKGTCVMFGEGDPLAKVVNKFCTACDPSVRESSVRNPQRTRNWP